MIVGLCAEMGRGVLHPYMIGESRTQAVCAAWAEREMAICARYVGVQIDGRLQLCYAEQAGR